MLNHQLPAMLPITSFWEALPEIFNWLHGQVAAPVLPTMPPIGGATEEIIRQRIIGLPAGSRGQIFIETIRFAAANRLLVNIDYRDQKGKRSTRAIEAYSLRRSRAGDVLLMAVRAEDGQPRSYRLDSILGVSQTQTTFSPRYPIELTPTGPQSIPPTSRPAAIVTPPTSTRRRSRASSGTTTYVFRCAICGKLFERKSYDGTLRPHKNRAGHQCYGTNGT
jgi:WYL domain-containing protein